MENLTGILSVAILVLVLFLWWLNSRLKSVSDSLEKNRQEITKIKNDLEITKGKLTRLNMVELDFSAMEDKIEENTQQLLNYIRQEIGEADKDIRDLEEAVNDLDERVDQLGEQENIGSSDVSN